MEQAEKEIQDQKASLRKYLQKELEDKEDSFQKTRRTLPNLKKLNDHLRVIENETNAEAKKIKQVLQARLREQKDFLTDYELEIDLVFYLREDDPEYSEDEDSILGPLIVTIISGMKTPMKTMITTLSAGFCLSNIALFSMFSMTT